MHPSHVANVDANAFLDDSCRAAHSTQHHSIAGSIKRKAGQNLLENLLITNAKLGQQETFHFQTPCKQRLKFLEFHLLWQQSSTT
jgi:hypothetical protein